MSITKKISEFFDLIFLKNQKRGIVILFIIISILLFFGSWNSLVRYIDDTYHAVIAKNLVISGDLFKPEIGFAKQTMYWQKPILFSIQSALGQAVFGHNSFGARFFITFYVYICLLIGFFIIKKYETFKTAFYVILVTILTQQVLFYSRRVLSDAPLFASSFVVFLSFFYANKNHKLYYLWGFFLGMAFMSKGIAALVIMLPLFLYIIFAKQWYRFKSRQIYFAVFPFLLVTLPWHIGMYNRYGVFFLKHYFWHEQVMVYFGGIKGLYNDWGRSVLIKKILENYWPWLPFFIAGTIIIIRNKIKKIQTNQLSNACKYALIWIISIFLFYQTGKILRYNYILPIYPAMAFVVTLVFHKIKRQELLKTFLSFIILVSLVFAFSPFWPKYLDSSLWDNWGKPVIKLINRNKTKLKKGYIKYPLFKGGNTWAYDSIAFYTGPQMLASTDKKLASNFNKGVALLVLKSHYKKLSQEIKTKAMTIGKTKEYLLLIIKNKT
ncbi:MAG: glycosyltransferase family 39 protein [Spirochaetes bacterium]|nr:glycosyltransferase family 39 protein [Spirochaetota bacterium]